MWGVYMEKSITKGNGLILLGLFVSLVIFFVMMIGVKNGSILSFDHYMQTLFDGCKSGILLFFERVSALGSTLVIGVGSVLFLLWLWFKEKNYLALVIFTVGVGGGNLLNKFVKNSMARPRPDGNLEVDSMSYSFPSGHAMVGLVFYVLLAYFITKEIKTEINKMGNWTRSFCAYASDWDKSNSTECSLHIRCDSWVCPYEQRGV